jgi:hypothetical protein
MHPVFECWVLGKNQNGAVLEFKMHLNFSKGRKCKISVSYSK